MRSTPSGIAGSCLTVWLTLAGTTFAADTPLIEAARSQDLASVRALLQENVDVNAAQPDGATALHWAAHRNNRELADLLLRAGANVDATNDYGVTSLILACLNASAPLIETLLNAGADPNLALPTGETPLMTASRTGSVQAVASLLDQGADVNASEPEAGQTALMWALAEQHVPVAKLLIARGADVQARSTSGFTPLMFAARHGNRTAANMLLANGANLYAAANKGITVLMVAVLRGHAALAEHFLDLGADPNASETGYTALHWAVGKWESTMTHDYPDTGVEEWDYLAGVPDGKLQLVKSLIAHGADVNARMTANPPRYGINLFFAPLSAATPFFLAALSADVEMMRVLVAAGAHPASTNAGDVTPLMVAAGLGRSGGDSLITEEESIDAVRLCLDLGNDINAADSQGNTALHGTAYYGNEKTAEFLVRQGADLNPKNKKDQTPLQVADGYEQAAMFLTRPDVAAVLRKLGASVN